MTCKDCPHFEVCKMYGVLPTKRRIGNKWKNCPFRNDKSKYIELPFIAMIEQYLVKGKFADNIYLQKFNGRYATVYIDKNKWGTPLIDICGKYPYNTEEAEARLKEFDNGTT